MKQSFLPCSGMYPGGSLSPNASQPTVVQDKACCSCFAFTSDGFAEYLNKLKVCLITHEKFIILFPNSF